MNIKGLVLSATAGLFLFACAAKVDEATLKQIDTLAGDIQTISTQATEFGTNLTNHTNACKSNGDSLGGAAYEAAKDKTKLDSIKNAHAEEMKNCEGIKSTFDGFNAEWTTLATDFASLKEKAAKGEIPADSVKVKVADVQSKVDKAKADLTSWSEALKKSEETDAAIITSFKEALNSSAAPAKTGKK